MEATPEVATQKNYINNQDPLQPNAGSDGEVKLTDWKREPTISHLKEDLDYARQETNDQKNNVEGWLHLRNATGPESGRKSKKPGRSGVQPKLIRKHNEWRYPPLSEPFLNTDRMFNVKPRTFEDAASAKQNELLLNWQFDIKINKVDFIDRYVRKTVDEGTCIVRVGWERKIEKVLVEKSEFSYYPLDPMDPEDAEGLQMLTEATEAYNQDPEKFANDPTVPEELLASVEYSAENQTPVYAKKTGTVKVHEEKVTFNQPSLKIVDVANFFIDPSCDGEWEQAQFMIHTYESTQSDLKKRKIYKNLENVNWSANAVKSGVGNQDHESKTPISDTRTSMDKTKVLVYEYWGLYDIHDDGEMVPIIATFIGDVMIQLTENPFPDRKPPFVIVPYMPILGSIFGEADASLLQDNQRVNGAIMRGLIDLLGRSANAQTGYAKGFLDPINRKRFTEGDDFEYNPNSDPRIAVQQMKYPEIPQTALQMQAAQQAEAEGLSGVKSFAGGITGDSYGQVAKGIAGALDAAGQREMSILRRLAEGMRLIGRKIISMNVHFLEESEIVRVTNAQFVTINKKDLGGNFDLIVDISTAQVDEQRSQDLGMLMQTVGPDMDPGLRSMLVAEIADLKRMPDLAERIRAYKPEHDPLEQRLKELQIAELEAKIELDKARAAQAMATANATEVDAQMEADGTKHQRTVEAQGAQARGNRDLEVTKGILKGEAPAQNIEAALGYNKLQETADQMQAAPKPKPAPLPPMAPVAPQQPMMDPMAPVALPQ